MYRGRLFRGRFGQIYNYILVTVHVGYCSRAEGLNEGYLPITDLVIMFDMTSRFFEYLNRTERARVVRVYWWTCILIAV